MESDAAPVGVVAVISSPFPRWRFRRRLRPELARTRAALERLVDAIPPTFRDRYSKTLTVAIEQARAALAAAPVAEGQERFICQNCGAVHEGGRIVAWAPTADGSADPIEHIEKSLLGRAPAAAPAPAAEGLRDDQAKATHRRLERGEKGWVQRGIDDWQCSCGGWGSHDWMGWGYHLLDLTNHLRALPAQAGSGGLDVERLARALHTLPRAAVTTDDGRPTVAHYIEDCESEAPAIAAAYAQEGEDDL